MVLEGNGRACASRLSDGLAKVGLCRRCDVAPYDDWVTERCWPSGCQAQVCTYMSQQVERQRMGEKLEKRCTFETKCATYRPQSASTEIPLAGVNCVTPPCPSHPLCRLYRPHCCARCPRRLKTSQSVVGDSPSSTCCTADVCPVARSDRRCGRPLCHGLVAVPH